MFFIVKDISGRVELWDECPVRNERWSSWRDNTLSALETHNHRVGYLKQTLFPELRYLDDPLEVELVVKGKSGIGFLLSEETKEFVEKDTDEKSISMDGFIHEAFNKSQDTLSRIRDNLYSPITRTIKPPIKNPIR